MKVNSIWIHLGCFWINSLRSIYFVLNSRYLDLWVNLDYDFIWREIGQIYLWWFYDCFSQGWQLCDGSVITEGPMAGKYTEDLNGQGIINHKTYLFRWPGPQVCCSCMRCLCVPFRIHMPTRVVLWLVDMVLAFVQWEISSASKSGQKPNMLNIYVLML